MTREFALSLIAEIQFRPFDKHDFMAFSGVDTENPLIGENDEYLVILDGNIVDVFVMDKDESFQFSLQNL